MWDARGLSLGLRKVPEIVVTGTCLWAEKRQTVPIAQTG